MTDFNNAVAEYYKEVAKLINRGTSTEHSFRPALKNFIESWQAGLAAVNEPRRVACGAPDLIVLKAETPVGHVECKDVGIDLKKIEKDKQILRYREALPNLILTDYLDFRWYENGELKMRASLTPPSSTRAKPDPREVAELNALATAFLSSKVPSAASPRQLADRMAALAKIIRQLIQKALEKDDEQSHLHRQFEAFKEVLLRDLKPEQFADMYAQTIAYGLFAAVVNHKTQNPAKPFIRELAARDIPKTNPFLRNIFNDVAGINLDDRVAWAVDHLTLLLDRADINAILENFGKRTRKEDPVVHFYETFLASYDPKMREARGVYYTPEPVVSYIVRSVDHVLKTDFNIKDGLADSKKIEFRDQGGKKAECHRVLVLDPATGTGTFLHSVIDNINQTLVQKGQAGAWSAYVKDHLLPRLFGFELLMAPYAVAHMKLGIQLQELGYDFKDDERLNVFLTNTLEEAFDPEGYWGMADIIAREAAEAGKVKENFPVMVVLGNPPYSGHSANESKKTITVSQKGKDVKKTVDTFIGGLVRDYYFVDGKPLGEKNPKWLQDDYVKFIRFAQWRIEKTGYGMLAFISNNGYLDNPTFRGMRRSLMNTFDDIYILDLHGNSKKKEKAPDGSKDENVFDIMQGVAIGIFVKKPDGDANKSATVRHADLWGVREIYEGKGEDKTLAGGKYKILYETGVDNTDWKKLKPEPPFYGFIVRDRKLWTEYEAGWNIIEAMKINSVGVVTARDGLTVHFSKENTWETVKEFSSLPEEKARQKFNLKQDSQDWKVSLAQKDLKESGPDEKNLAQLLYRPFDQRWTYYTGNSSGFMCRPRPETMRHMLAGENLGLLTCRQIISHDWRHVSMTRALTNDCSVSNLTRERTYLFPLYLYNSPTTEARDLISFSESSEEGDRRANLSDDFIRDFSGRLGLKYLEDGSCRPGGESFGPEDVFHYIYAVFHSPTYRARYAEFLKMDFPRVPLTSNPELFWELVKLGRRLTGLHLLEDTPGLITSYPKDGGNEVEKVRYVDKEERVYINADQYFGGVPREVWDFHVGGYRVAEKWLKDRTGRELSHDDIGLYQKIIAALSGTMEIMDEIDQAISANNGFPLQ